MCVAQWIVNKYPICFDANGGTGGEQNEMEYGSELVPPEVELENHIFLGWVPEVPSTVPDHEMTFVAQWEEIPTPKINITFDANGGVGGETLELEVGTPIVPPTVTKEGHTFVGWDKQVPDVAPDEDTTYVAQWTPNQYVVTFDANGGEGGTQETMEYGAEITPPTVTKEGYVFNGWMPEVDSVVPANDVTYVAQWEEEYEPPFDDPVGLPEVDLESPPDSDF